MMRALSGRVRDDGTADLAAPVRILLVERAGSGEWLNWIVGTGSTGHRVRAAHARTDLQLATISDVWPLIAFVLRQAGRRLPERERTLEILSSIDKERRPLFAYFMADAMAAGRDVHQFDASGLLDDVIERWGDKFWQPAGAGASEERTLALATMIGELQVTDIAGLKDELLVHWNVDRHPEAFSVMTGQSAAEKISALEPDIVGEHFTLETLARENLADRHRARLCGHAWRLSPFAMAGFVHRVHHDFPGHTMLPFLRKSPPDEGRKRRQRESWADAATILMINLSSIDPKSTRELLDDMRRLAKKHNDVLLWKRWAQGASYLVRSLSSVDTEGARVLLDDMREMAETHNDVRLWVSWAEGASSLTENLSSIDPAAGRALLNQIRGIAETHDDVSLWQAWADAASSLIADLGSSDRAAVRALLDDVREVAETKNDLQLWTEWVEAASSVVADLGSSDTAAARALLDDIRRVAGRHNEVYLWQQWAEAAGANLIGYLDLTAARALLDDMRGVAEKYGMYRLHGDLDLSSLDSATRERLERPLLWASWGEAASTLIVELGEKRPCSGACAARRHAFGG